MDPLLIVLFVIIGIMFLFFLYGSFIRWYASRLTLWFAIKKLEIDKSMEEYARLLLDEYGLVDVEVKRVGFFASLFIGNTYSASKKLIRLSWGVGRRASVTNLASVCRLVGLAKMDAEGIKGLKAIELNRWFSFLPILLVPLIIIGLIVDLIMFEALGMWSIIFTAIGLALSLFSFIVSCVAAKKDFQAYNRGQEIILSLQILNESEEKKVKKLISAWKKLVIINVIINAFELIYFLLKIIFSSFKLFGRK